MGESQRFSEFCGMWLLRQVGGFLRHQLVAKKPTDMHSPYLFEMLRFMHDNSREYYAFRQIEGIRDQLLKRNDPVPSVDFGAGSRRNNQTISQVTKVALSSQKKCEDFFRLAAFHKPKVILELGTSLGVMTAYLASGATSAEVHSLEGNPFLSDVASGIAKTLELDHVHFHVGSFDQVLPGLVPTLQPVDLVLIDGDHRGDALVKYFQILLPCLSDDAIVIADDIRWTEDMYAGWKQISAHPQVTCTLDYFQYGMLLFRKEFQEKLVYRIRCSS